MKDLNTNQLNNPSPDKSQTISKLENMILKLGRSVANHPGFMWGDFGFEVLHAEWPAYPWGHGVAPTLNSLGEFPRDTKFFPIDRIDRCTLFVVGKKPKENLFSQEHFHVAIWDEDLKDCVLSHYIEGIQEDMGYVNFPNGYIELTHKGINSITINAFLGQFVNSIENEIITFLHEAQYDTAIREISLRIEVELRHVSGISVSGRKLVEKCFGEQGILVPKELTNPSRLRLRNAFHAYFKYVRNEYHHEIPSVDMITACMLMRRSAELLAIVKFLEQYLKLL